MRNGAMLCRFEKALLQYMYDIGQGRLGAAVK